MRHMKPKQCQIYWTVEPQISRMYIRIVKSDYLSYVICVQASMTYKMTILLAIKMRECTDCYGDMTYAIRLYAPFATTKFNNVRPV